MILLIKQYRGSKNKTLHYFGAYTKIVEHIISKEQINTSLNTRFCQRQQNRIKLVKSKVHTILEFTPKS